MPVKANILEQMLTEVNYDATEIEYLASGFRTGFNLDYREPMNRTDRAKNLPFREIGSHPEVWEKMMKEVSLGRLAGPYQDVPYQYYV